MPTQNEPAYYRTEQVHYTPRGVYARASLLSFLCALSVVMMW